MITTHDVHFFEALRRSLGTGGYSYQRITGWTLEGGPIFGDPLTDFDRVTVPEVRARLSEETLSAAAGRFFEWLLKELVERLEVSGPLRFSRGYEIAILWQPLSSKLRKNAGFSAEKGELIKGLEENAWVRNACGAHFNPTPAPPTPAEVQEFGRLLAELHAATRCGSCGYFIKKQENDDWVCACGKTAFPHRLPKPN